MATRPSLLAPLFAAGPHAAGFVTRSLLTLLVVVLTVAAARGLQRWFSRTRAAQPHEARCALVAARNVLAVASVLAVLALWLVPLTHFALSLAALATGLLLTAKELVLGLLGRLLHATARPFAVGDVVDLGPHSGRVIDIGLFTTRLLETDAARQYTGHTVELPNALLATASVRNLSHTGRFVIESLRVPVAADATLPENRERLLACTRRACAADLDEAVRFLARVEADEVLSLPDFQPRVLIEPRDAYQVDLVARFPAPSARRAYVAQSVLAEFYGERRPVAAAPSGWPGAAPAQIVPIGRSAAP
jgi:small-conductance mechanosensitive channel